MSQISKAIDEIAKDIQQTVETNESLRKKVSRSTTIVNQKLGENSDLIMNQATAMENFPIAYKSPKKRPVLHIPF